MSSTTLKFIDPADRWSRGLIDEALKNGGEKAWKEFDFLNRRYVQFTFASSRAGFNPFRPIPFGTNDPRPYDGPIRSIEFTSARMYFDTMLSVAPRAFRDYAHSVVLNLHRWPLWHPPALRPEDDSKAQAKKDRYSRGKCRTRARHPHPTASRWRTLDLSRCPNRF